MDEFCINCYYFEELNPTTHEGQCRFMPPRGIDDKSLPSGTDPVNVFPPVDDGTVEFCGQFRTNTP